MYKRGSGVLMHISSLSSDYGIGTLGKAAYDFVDFLKAAGQSYWQVLPVGPTGKGNSPYQSFSSYAGNYMFICLDSFLADGVINKEDITYHENFDREKVDFDTLNSGKLATLKTIYNSSAGRYIGQVETFTKENSHWIFDYALFIAVHEHFGELQWQDWDEDIKNREPSAIEKYSVLLSDQINFWCFVQWAFFVQWTKLKNYANENGIQIIGDIPIYVSSNSVDTWKSSGEFKLDDHRIPTVISGCPPDYFCAEGQKWDNPVYDWDFHKSTGYSWWIDRLKASMKLYDIVRIDHFRGLDEYWEIEKEQPASQGRWEKGPGMDFINAVKANIENPQIIAEDLGYLSEGVIWLRDQSGYPGMVVLQFAFGSDDDNLYLPHNHKKNAVIYTGTHDNNTTMGWRDAAYDWELQTADRHLEYRESEEYNWKIIRGCMSSVCDICITPVQDFLGLDSGSRMNTPGTAEGNWAWRVMGERLDSDLATRIREMTNEYHRI